MDEKAKNNLWKFISGSDMEFYEEFLVKLSEEELQRFLDDNPDFLREDSCGCV